MRYFLLVIFLVASSGAMAEDKIEIYCENAQNQFALNECSGKALQDSEKELKEIYDAAIKHLQETNQSTKEALFIETQEIWKQYTKMNCEVEAGKRENSGSIWPFLVNSCNARMNFQRIEEIKATTYLEQ